MHAQKWLQNVLLVKRSWWWIKKGITRIRSLVLWGLRREVKSLYFLERQTNYSELRAAPTVKALFDEGAPGFFGA